MSRPSPSILTRAAIIQAAWMIVDSDGVEGLSTRRLAAELKVRGPSLYYHFCSKDEILDGIVDEIYKRVELRAEAPDWEAVITEYATQLRTVLGAHPNVVMYFAMRPVPPAGLAVYDRLFREFVDSGWGVELQREVVIAVENLVLGAAIMAHTPTITLTEEDSKRYPVLANYFDRPAGRFPDDGFDVGFSALMDGLRNIPVHERKRAVGRSTGRSKAPQRRSAAV